MFRYITSMKIVRGAPFALPVLMMLGLLSALQSGAGFNPFQITMENGSPYYQPIAPTVQPHRPIEWINPTASPHTIRHDGCVTDGPCAFDSGEVPPNGSYAIAGLPPGRYPYHCQIHPIMRGELHVLEAVAPAAGTDL